MKRRMLAMLMCLAMLLVLIPTQAQATIEEEVVESVLGGEIVATDMTQADATACPGHNYTSVSYGTTCQTYAHTQYTCVNCGDSYNVYPDGAMSDWQTEKPNVDASMIETGTQYRYCDYTTVTSFEPSMEGYELAGAQWVMYDQSTVNYVNTWPSGFDTSHSLYNKYDNKSQKVSNSSTDMTKVEVNSDQITGYLYYHWCASGKTPTSATKTSTYTNFHAYYSTSTPSSANSYDSSDNSYRFDNSTACSNSKWYFAVPVYGQSYTSYRSQFIYRCWGEPSQWSMTPVTETDSRKVETRTVYRYVIGALSKHNYVNGVCSVCGELKVNADFYLFGYINGENYACEEDHTNMGIYKFVNGKLTARFQQDSYVAVKTEGNSDWYMTSGWQGNATTVTLYNSNILNNADKLLVPGGAELEFTLVDNGNDTLTLSYAIKECSHNYESVVTTPGTCLNSGKMTYTCTICGHSYVQNISATGHTMVAVLTKPTCGEGGYTTYTCSFCGYSYIGDRTAAAGHSYSSVIVPHTCTDMGYTVYTCGGCGYSYQADYTAASHNYVNGVCSVCGEQDANYTVDYYLVGWINGADHGCDSDYTNPGSYKFVNGQLTATFNQASYVFIKTGDNAKWLLAPSYCESTTCTFSEGNNERMFVPGNVSLTFTLTENADGSVTLSYVQSTNQCQHSYTSKVTTVATCTTSGVTTHTCTKCGSSYTTTIAATGHNYLNGSCVKCGIKDTSTESGTVQTYYLVGWINGADHGCESDWENMGNYKIEGGKLTTTFTEDSYVFVKSADNNRWFLAESYCDDTTCTFMVGGSEKMFVPGGVEVTFTLVETDANAVTLSYVKNGSSCAHSYTSSVTTAATCTTSGVKTFTCTKCASSYTQTIEATGHSYLNGYCMYCGAQDPNQSTTSETYYLIGWINGADYGCESDWENLGQYQFVNGKLTATFTEDSYVFVKNGSNSKWFLAESYCEDTTCTFAEGNSEKMFVPGGKTLTFTLTENANGSVTISYTTASASTVPTLTLKAPTLEFKDMITVNAMFTAENIQDVAEMGMITYSTKVSSWNINNAEHVIPGTTYDASTGRYIAASQGIHAKYLGDTVYLAVYAKLNDGTYAYSKLAGYSPVQYATSKLSGTDAALKQLVVAMLNYGAAAQNHFGHNTSALANASLTAAQKALPAAYSSSMVSTVGSVPTAKQGSFAGNTGFAKRYPSISFEGAFCINYFFTPSYAPDNGITLYYWNAADYNAASVLKTSNATGSIKMSGSGTGEYQGDITGIAAKALSEAVYVTAVYTNGGTTYTSGVLGYSIGAYCSSQATKGGTIAELAKATAVYGYHAKAYFG